MKKETVMDPRFAFLYPLTKFVHKILGSKRQDPNVLEKFIG